MENHGPIESENKLEQGKRSSHHRYIYIRSTRQQIPVSEQQFLDYYRDINAYRRRMQEHKSCNCPPRCWMTCDMDCLTCPFHCGNEFLSLDAVINANSDGNPITLGDTIPDDTPSIEDIVSDKQLLDTLFAELNKLDPDMRRIVELTLDGKSERQIAAITGASKHSTVNYRKKKAFQALQERMKEHL